jgi:hypothetical protein
MNFSIKNNTQYGYPTHRALQQRPTFQDAGVGHGAGNEPNNKAEQIESYQKVPCSSGVCPLPNKSHPSDRYPCGYRNFT